MLPATSIRGRDAVSHGSTDQACEVLLRANEEAHRLQRRRVGTENVLFGLTEYKEGSSSPTLKRFGVTAEGVREAVRAGAVREPEEASPSSRARMVHPAEPGETVLSTYVDLDQETDLESVWLPFSLQAEEAFALANLQSRRRGHFYVGTAHLLLGLLGNERFAATRVLQNLGVDRELLQIEVTQVMEETPEVPEPSLADIQAEARQWETNFRGDPDPSWTEQDRLLDRHRRLVPQVFNEHLPGCRGYVAIQVLGEAEIALWEAITSEKRWSSDEEFSNYAISLMRQRIDERLRDTLLV